jgi:hypothetical protein
VFRYTCKRDGRTCSKDLASIKLFTALVSTLPLLRSLSLPSVQYNQHACVTSCKFVHKYLGIAPAKSAWPTQAPGSGNAPPHTNKRCPPGSPTRLPTRVIAVEERGLYATLSTAWVRGLTTTISNYTARKSGFRLSDLPTTCRDAVLVARSLHTPYVWIDPLCIIQDSRSDWERESASMCSVYQNALVTLAALE